MAFEHILFEAADGIGRLTINRPKALNALNTATLEEIDACVAQVASDDAVKGLIITGAGEKAFVAGADITAFPNLTGPAGKTFAQYGQEVFNRIENLAKPVVAAVNGFALGGGLELALACHMRIFSEKAIVGLPEVSLGIIPGYGGTQRLPRLVGKGIALELILTGKRLDAAEAHRIGLANHVVAPDAVLPEAEKLLGAIMKNGPLAVGFAIEAVNGGLEMSLTEGLRHEAALFGNTAATEDMREGAAAFLEKRKAAFKGQ